MTEAINYHQTLRSGLKLISAKRNERDEIVEVIDGTLSGLARRNSDGAKVLVTNLHIITAPHIST